MKNFCEKIKNNKIWFVVIFLVLVFSVPSIWRLYQIRHLYLSETSRKNAVAANVAIRQDYGIGATDLKLKKIEKKSTNIIFYFDYFYHGSAKYWSRDKGTFVVSFCDDKLIEVKKYEEN